jgi:EmrB/QacA subfamily drug resistance transporter
MTATAQADEDFDPGIRKLIRVLVLGALAPALDATVVNVALAALGRGLRVSVATSQWTLTGYLLAMGMAVPAARWVSERFGGKRAWLCCLGVFLAGSALAGAAPDMTSLIVFRVVQGAAAGVMMPLLTTLLTQAAGRRRLGRMMTIAMTVIVVVPIFGPVVGGVIVTSLGWRWIFYLNVPVCLAAIWLAWRTVPPDAASQEARPLDIGGLALLSPGLALVIYGLAEAAGPRGFAAATAWAPLAGGTALVTAFTVHTLRTKRDPLINLRLLRLRSYTAALALQFLAGVSVYGPLLLLALYYQDLQGKSAIVAGLLLAPQGIGSMTTRNIAGKLTDRIGPRPLALAGLVLTAAGTLAFAWAGPAASESLLAASLLIRGAGLAPVTIAVGAGTSRDVPAPSVPDASMTARIIQQLGGSLGSAMLAVILAAALASHHAAPAFAFDLAFRWAIAFTAAALIPALLLPAAKQPRQDRTRPPRLPANAPFRRPRPRTYR